MKIPVRRKDRLRGSAFAVHAAASLLSLALLFSCSLASSTRSMFGGRLPFKVTVAPDANENSAVAVDLVVVYDSKVADDLLKLPASDWFARKQQFVKDNPRKVAVHGWEWVPGQRVDDKAVSYEAGAKKIVLFANYATEGVHRRALDPQQPFHLTLGAIDFDAEVNK